MSKLRLNGIDFQEKMLVARLNRRSRFHFADNRVMSSTHCPRGMKRNVHVSVGEQSSLELMHAATRVLVSTQGPLNVCCDGPFF